MNTLNIYNTLTKIVEEGKQNYEGLIINQDKLSKLIEELKIEVLSSEGSSFSAKQRINYCLKYAKGNSASKKKPVLAYGHTNSEGFQEFTNSYFAVRLAEEDKLPLEDFETSDIAKNGGQYVNLELLFRGAFNNYEYETEIIPSDILKQAKVSKKVEINGKEYSNEMLVPFLKFMNLTSNFPVAIRINETKHMLTIKNEKTGSKGLMILV